MIDDDPLGTRRDLACAVPLELSAAGFEDAHEIGRGGFGLVYRCVQTSLDRTVAVKVLNDDFDEENSARFFREQRAMGRLTGHPNIMDVLQVGTTDTGHPYLVMPYYPQDSLETLIRAQGPLPVDEALRLGVKMTGALATAHGLGILHRDVKPANILLTDYGEPVLTDFGIAHISGGFRTATGTVTGSPAFTAPEVLSGESPSQSSDIYSLGATLFCALTGHAAFERRSGEQVVAQFLRITTQPVPNLRESGIPEDVAAAIEDAMCTDPHARPVTATQFGDTLRQIQLRHGFPVDEMAVRLEPGVRRRDIDASGSVPGSTDRPSPSAIRGTQSSTRNLPVDLTSFVGRRHDQIEVKHLLSTARLVTLTGIGGVGKTRLALRVAAEVRRGFKDGVWLVELGELRTGSLLVDIVASALGLREHSGRRLEDVVVEFLAERKVLLVLDNCEQVVDSVARLAEMLLSACPGLTILATSREALGIAGETVRRVLPLSVPDSDHHPHLKAMPQYDAVTLFVQRAAAVVPGFELTEDNHSVVTKICQRLDGLPLPIELAASRLRAMSAAQVLERLSDRFTILTRGTRDAPTRQQTLRLSIDWSYDLCTPREQTMWARLSVFAGSFELDAAASICAAESLLDDITSLVDKSILIREEAGASVRLRLLDTLREYGQEKLQETGEYTAQCRQHMEWCRNMVVAAQADWISPRQLEWMARLTREQSNLRKAMEFALSEDVEPDELLRISSSLLSFWLARGLLSEGRHWLERALARRPDHPTSARAAALYAESVLVAVQGDYSAGTALVEEGRNLADRTNDPLARALIDFGAGTLALFHNGDHERACMLLEGARAVFASRNDIFWQVRVLEPLGWAYQLRGDTSRCIECNEQVLQITTLHGESVNRAYALWALGIAVWKQGDGDAARAEQLLEDALRLARQVDDPVNASMCLEALAWLCDARSAQKIAVLLGAADALGHQVGVSAVLFRDLLVHHERAERIASQELGRKKFEAARNDGAALSFEEAAAYALDEQHQTVTPSTPTTLTKRELQVSELVAEGMTNRAIASKLVISQRTAQGHVEHILTKLGFTSRAQIAAWVVERSRVDRD
ncbi:protein kinase domain-containing protein [Rhodococcus koreensis]